MLNDHLPNATPEKKTGKGLQYCVVFTTKQLAQVHKDTGINPNLSDRAVGQVIVNSAYYYNSLSTEKQAEIEEAFKASGVNIPAICKEAK